MTRTELAEVDERITLVLQTDVRNASSSDIAETAGLSASTVRNRIRRLEEGVI
jgi:DNA-binding Lrp family transcriptional regulator